MSERFRRWRQHVFVFIAVWALLGSAGCSNPFDVFLDDDDGPGPPPPSEFVATLSGDQEVPPVDTVASGESVLTLDANETLLNFEVTIADLPSNDVTQVTLNVAPPGFNGPIVFFLTRGGAIHVPLAWLAHRPGSDPERQCECGDLRRVRRRPESR